MTRTLAGLHGLEMTERSYEIGYEGDPFVTGRCLCGLGSWPEFFAEHGGREGAQAAVRLWFAQHLDRMGVPDVEDTVPLPEPVDPSLDALERRIYHHPEGWSEPA